MDELIARVAAKAGIPADQAEQAVNLVFAFLKKQAPEPFAEVEQAIPGPTPPQRRARRRRRAAASSAA